MASNKIALEDLTAEQEADRLLAEEDAAGQGLGGKSGTRANDDAFKADLQDLEESESLPQPVTSNQTTAVRSLLLSSLSPRVAGCERLRAVPGGMDAAGEAFAVACDRLRASRGAAAWFASSGAARGLGEMRRC